MEEVRLQKFVRFLSASRATKPAAVPRTHRRNLSSAPNLLRRHDKICFGTGVAPSQQEQLPSAAEKLLEAAALKSDRLRRKAKNHGLVAALFNLADDREDRFTEPVKGGLLPFLTL